MLNRGGGRAPRPPGGLVLLPAVDVLDGTAVRLEQGDFERRTASAGDPAELVRRFASYRPAWIHVVDLDAARTGTVRPGLVRGLTGAAGRTPVQVAGGVRTPADALALVDAGARRVVVGTPAFAEAGPGPYVEALGERLVVAIDVRSGKVMTDGWRRSSGISAADAVDRCVESGVPRLLCTAVERDGTLAGPDCELVEAVVERSRLPVLAAGGIRSERDLAALAVAGAEGAIVGRALLDGSLPLELLQRSNGAIVKP
jgi:phosphoribosylformimino-5-aminoimidazole carboxamide ribotide isomerase